MTSLCSMYGHQWETDPQRSVSLPAGYRYESCKWCAETRTIMEY